MVNAEININERTGIKMTIMKQLFTLILFCIYGTTLNAGEVVEMTSKDLTSPNKAAETLEFLFSDGFMKMSTDEQNDVIFNSDDANMMVLSHAEKSYFIFNKDTASNIKSEIDKVMEEALAQVPPEQRAMVEEMMKKQMQGMGAAPEAQAAAPKVDFSKVGRSDNINGYSCEYYEVTSNGQKEAELCLTSWSNIDASDNMQNSFKAMSEMMEGFLEQISQFAPTQKNDNPFSYLKEMDGYPVLSRQFSNGVATNETILKSITEKDIDQSIFNAPEGYTKQEMMGM